MFTRIFLALNVLLWLPYGIACFLDPSLLDGAAGVAANTATGTTELRSMYGGLQAAMGALAAYGLLAGAGPRRAALTTLCFLPAGLAIARLAGGSMDGDWSSYTLGALGLEITLTAVSAVLLRREPPLF
jgi:hypothetical protein